MDGHVLAEDNWPLLSPKRLEFPSRWVSTAARLQVRTIRPTGIVDLTSRVEVVVCRVWTLTHPV